MSRNVPTHVGIKTMAPEHMPTHPSFIVGSRYLSFYYYHCSSNNEVTAPGRRIEPSSLAFRLVQLSKCDLSIVVRFKHRGKFYTSGFSAVAGV